MGDVHASGYGPCINSRITLGFHDEVSASLSVGHLTFCGVDLLAVHQADCEVVQTLWTERHFLPSSCLPKVFVERYAADRRVTFGVYCRPVTFS